MPWRRKWQPTPVFFLGEFPGQRSLVGYSPRGWKVFQFSFRILSLLGEIYQRRRWHPTPVLLPGKSHGWRSPVGCSPWVAQSQTRLSDFTFTFHFHALEKEMATHSSILAWWIPGTGEPGGLPSMGSHRVWHDWSDLIYTVSKTRFDPFWYSTTLNNGK